MKCVVVNDASCLIDLRKGGLLPVLCRLSYQFVVPLPIRESELLDFTEAHWQQLDQGGLVTHDLSPDEVGLAFALKAQRPGLSANDCFCLVTALAFQGILLTGDAQLRNVAQQRGVRVHGVLWIVDELDAEDVCPRPLLIRALSAWRADATVFLPEDEVANRLGRLAEP